MFYNEDSRLIANHREMDFLNEFEIIGGIIPNLLALAFFCGVIIYFDQTRKAKVRRGEKVTPHQ